uniref:Solute carrier family 26 member 10-like n=1 Tax=Diabrotica virgifera virgifera TaxID=50390 RepID=A0A6P7H4T0_DIAVI
FPKPSVPPVSIMGSIIVDCIFISLVSYISNMSMALIFSRQFMYEIDANQELLALGASNVLGSFLSCLPMCVSLSRSVIQVTSGGVTQIVSVVSALLLIFVLLWFAPFFETLPRGMGFAMLGNVPPVIGIYMGIFPVLIYFILGTSRHVNQGTFAVTCLMTGKVVSHHATVHIKEVKDAYEPEEPAEYTNIQIGAAVTFVVAFMEIIMYVCRFGVTASLLSESLVSGFTCGAAFHVVNSQLRDILGVPIDKHFGAFSIPLTLYDIARNIHKSNYIAVIMSILTFAALILNHIFLKRRWRKLTRIPLPIELILILLGILAIDVIHLERDYDVTVVGRIPKGFPKPSVPPVSIMGSIIVDCIFISLVSYISNMSMALIFSRQFMYEIDANQELLALGASNVLGSFLSCLPMCVSLSRSVIQVTSGGVTQIVSVVSALLLIFVLLWFAPFFETLPR